MTGSRKHHHMGLADEREESAGYREAAEEMVSVLGDMKMFHVPFQEHVCR